ncbi:hypothetical protein KR044_011188 [Drosophila immigrans]|nr:hypothetical protein KR044_011188 [Drosophila immigrans]
MTLLQKVGCLRLHTAGVVVGWLGVAGALLTIIISGYLIGFADSSADYLISAIGVRSNPESHEGIGTVIVVYGCIFLGGAINSGLAAGLLVFGTIKNRHLMILPWLVVHAFGIFFTGLLILIASYVELTLMFLAGLLYLALYCYIYLGIVSLYKQIQMKNDVENEMTRIEAVPVEKNDFPNPEYVKL